MKGLGSRAGCSSVGHPLAPESLMIRTVAPFLIAFTTLSAGAPTGMNDTGTSLGAADRIAVDLLENSS
jgi:hypothetical protein